MNIEEYEIPPCSVHGCYYNDSGRVAATPANLANSESQIDEEAVFSLLQFGAIIPPLSPWKNVRRILPGLTYRGYESDSTGTLGIDSEAPLQDVEKQADRIEGLLDSILKQCVGEKNNPILLFSGGVDSGLIACRLASLGFKDTLLLNYSFHADDPESVMAESMAKELGLKFERVLCEKQPCACLENPGIVYPQPFGDHSTPYMSELAIYLIERFPNENRLVIDGTGADGAFGMHAKVAAWAALGRIPPLLSSLASIIYAKGMWHRTGSREYVTRILRRSRTMPLLSAVVSQNPLAGVFYKDSCSENVYSKLEDWISGWAGKSSACQAVAADLALTCANIFAQKGLSILEAAGHTVVYPFLEKKAVSMALSSITRWNMEEPKAPLKKSLSRYVPRDMVYRQKSGFVDPVGEVFFDERFIHYLSSSCDSSGPIAHLLERKSILKACRYLMSGKDLPAQTRNLLWAVVFADRWYRTVPKSA